MNETPSIAPTAASASLYASDVARIEDFILRGRIAAQMRGEDFGGITIDIDTDGFMEVFCAGLEPIRL